MAAIAVDRLVPRADVVVLIPESTRKRPGGTPDPPKEDAIAGVLPPKARDTLVRLRADVLQKSPARSVDAGRYLPAHERFDGNMYRSIPPEAWENRAEGVEVVIASGLLGLIASRDRVPSYRLSMAEPIPPFGKLNRWWHAAGLPDLLAEYLRTVGPTAVVDLLSLEYRESVAGYEGRIGGIRTKPIDFPGMGRASQPRRGEAIAAILRTGRI